MYNDNVISFGSHFEPGLVCNTNTIVRCTLSDACYLAPEAVDQYRAGEKAPNYNLAKADVWSLGMTLLAAFTLSDVRDVYNLNLNKKFK